MSNKKLIIKKKKQESSFFVTHNNIKIKGKINTITIFFWLFTIKRFFFPEGGEIISHDQNSVFFKLYKNKNI